MKKILLGIIGFIIFFGVGWHVGYIYYYFTDCKNTSLCNYLFLIFTFLPGIFGFVLFYSYYLKKNYLGNIIRTTQKKLDISNRFFKLFIINWIIFSVIVFIIYNIRPYSFTENPELKIAFLAFTFPLILFFLTIYIKHIFNDKKKFIKSTPYILLIAIFIYLYSSSISKIQCKLLADHTLRQELPKLIYIKITSLNKKIYVYNHKLNRPKIDQKYKTGNDSVWGWAINPPYKYGSSMLESPLVHNEQIFIPIDTYFWKNSYRYQLLIDRITGEGEIWRTREKYKTFQPAANANYECRKHSFKSLKTKF